MRKKQEQEEKKIIEQAKERKGKVTFSMTETINTGNYENVKISVAMSEEWMGGPAEAYRNTKEFVREKLEKAVNQFKRSVE